MNNEEHILSKEKPDCFFFRASAPDFKKIPGSPIAYWVSDRIRNSFIESSSLNDIAQPRKGITTADNDKYLRNWFEVELGKAALKDCIDGIKWYPVNKGGDFRKWNGNKEIVINWKNDGEEIKKFDNSVIRNPSFYFKEGMTWNDISSGKFAMRYSDDRAMFEGKGPMAFAENNDKLINLISFFNSIVSASILSVFFFPAISFVFFGFDNFTQNSKGLKPLASARRVMSLKMLTNPQPEGTGLFTCAFSLRGTTPRWDRLRRS